MYPINAMGMTKALMEKVAQAMARGMSESETVVSSVRYGNVMCSRGSVIPLFIKQIKERNDALLVWQKNLTKESLIESLESRVWHQPLTVREIADRLIAKLLRGLPSSWARIAVAR